MKKNTGLYISDEHYRKLLGINEKYNLLFFLKIGTKELKNTHFYDIIANSRSPRHGGFRLGSLYESVQT